jgi:hypothetical protein
MRMAVTKRERAIVEAARVVQRLQDRRIKLRLLHRERLERLESKFSEDLLAIDREIEAAKDALRTFTDAGQETVADNPKGVMV